MCRFLFGWPYSDEHRVEYDISNDFQNADSKNNVAKRYSKRIIDRSDWDDVSDSSDKKYRRFKGIKPKRLEYTEGKNKNNLHYEVSGHVTNYFSDDFLYVIYI
jgi:hypothetical protein